MRDKDGLDHRGSNRDHYRSKIWDILRTEPSDFLMDRCGQWKSRIITRSWPSRPSRMIIINIILIFLQFVASWFMHLKKNSELTCASFPPPQHCENGMPKFGAKLIVVQPLGGMGTTLLLRENTRHE